MSNTTTHSLITALQRMATTFRFTTIRCFIALFPLFTIIDSAQAQVSITTAGVAYTENFTSTATTMQVNTASATLPAGFKIGTDWSIGTTLTGQAAGTTGAVFTTGGAYNYANGDNATSTERALGFLSSGGYASPRSIMFAFTNNTGATVSSITVNWNYEKYRSGTRAFNWTFFHGNTSTALTSNTNGDQAYAADLNNTTLSNPPSSIPKTTTITGLSIPSGSTYYLRWTYTGVGGSSNAQGLGIDDFSLTLNAAGIPAVTINGGAPPASSFVQGSTNNIIYTDTIVVENTAARMKSIPIRLNGNFVWSIATNTAEDIVNLKCWQQASEVLNTSTANLLYNVLIPTDLPITYYFPDPGILLPVGKSHLFFTVDVTCGATIGRFVQAQTQQSADPVHRFTFLDSVTFTLNSPTGNGHTFSAAAAPSDVTTANAASGNTQLAITWTAPAGCYDEVMVVATNAASVSATPSGNGSAYTANANFGAGTLIGNAYTIYRGTGTGVVLSNLVNGTTYQIRIFTRKGSVWSLANTAGANCQGTPSGAGVAGDYRSRTSGGWNAATTWEKFVSGFWQPSTESPNSNTASVTIRSGHTVLLDVSLRNVRNLTVNNGGKLYCNTFNPTGTTNNYIILYGNIVCDGIIGNGATLDDICFNIEGVNDTISGTGDFSCSRIRKLYTTQLTTNLYIDMNVRSYWAGTALYNAVTSGVCQFNVTLNAGRTFNCVNNGNICIDNINGSAVGSDSYGTFTINGTLICDSLYFTTNNAANQCHFQIGTTGTVYAQQVLMSASGTATHLLTMQPGARLFISGANAVFPFSSAGQTFNIQAGSTIFYDAVFNQPIESGIPYANLTLAGSGVKTANNNVSVTGTLTLSSGTTYSQNAFTTTIGSGGTLLANGGALDAGASAGTISFAGDGTFKGTTALTFNILTINAGIVKDSLNNCNAQTLNLNGTGILNIGADYQLNMLFGATVNGNGGNFSTGAEGGTLNFTGSGAFTGTSSPYNVFISGGVDFGIGTTTIQNAGRLRINAGGSVITNAPFYAIGSILEYNWGSSGTTAGLEWTTNSASGRGVPHHVQIGTNAVNTTRVSFTGSLYRQANGDLNIGPASGGTGYRLSLSATAGGDLRVGGNWTRAASALFTPNGRSVIFNGTTANQTITVLGGGTEVFSYLVLNKTGAQNLVLSASPATIIAVNGGSGGNALQLLNGNLDLNGQALSFSILFNGFVNNIGIDGPAGNTTRRINSTIPGGSFVMYNADPGVPRVSTINRLSANASLLSFSAGTTLSIGGLSQNSGINFGPSYSYILGTFRLDTWGYVETNPPFYGSNATLIYNTGADYNRFTEWSATTGAGYPFNITVQNNTRLRVNDDNLPVNNGGNGTADRALAGTLTISSGSTLIMGDSTENNRITIGKDLVLNGTLTMPSTTTAIGADVYLAGNWNRSATGIFNHNERAVFFNGTTNSTITAVGGQYFPYLYLSKSTSANTLSLLDNISIGKIFTINTGKFDLAAKDATLLSNASATAQFGQVGTNADVLYSSTGRFVVERYLPTGTGPGQHGKSWQFLAVPVNGGQTIKQAWQEGANTPNGNPNPGYGTQITGNVGGSPAGAHSLGFDVFTPAGPSVKGFNNGNWIGVPNTTSTTVYRKEGYMVFVRGDRSVTQFNQAAVPTTLRTRGKLFVPGSNPPPVNTIPAGSFQSIGNPYASTIEFTAIDGPGVPDVDPVYYVWDPLLTGTNSVGGYQMISANNGDFYPTPGGTANYPSNVRCTKIQSGQAFLMRATGAGGDIIINESAKIAGSANTFRPPVSVTDNKQYLRIYLHNGISSTDKMVDGAVVAFSELFSNGYDYNDALKLNKSGENLSIYANDKHLVLDARPKPSLGDTIQLNMTGLSTRSYQWRIAPIRMIQSGVTAILVDRLDNSRYDVSSDDTTYHYFEVNSHPMSYAPNRFYIVFGKKRGPVSSPAILSEIAETARSTDQEVAQKTPSIRIYPNPAKNGNTNLIINKLHFGKAKMIIYTMSGQVVFQQNMLITTAQQTIPLQLFQLTKNSYRIEITDSKGCSFTEQLLVD